MLLPFHMILIFDNAPVVWTILDIISCFGPSSVITEPKYMEYTWRQMSVRFLNFNKFENVHSDFVHSRQGQAILLKVSRWTSGVALFSLITYLLTLPLFLVGHDVGYYGPPFFPVGSNFCASVYVHSCISGDVSQPSASLASSTAFTIYHAFCDYTL